MTTLAARTPRRRPTTTHWSVALEAVGPNREARLLAGGGVDANRQHVACEHDVARTTLLDMEKQ